MTALRQRNVTSPLAIIKPNQSEPKAVVFYLLCDKIEHLRYCLLCVVPFKSHSNPIFGFDAFNVFFFTFDINRMKLFRNKCLYVATGSFLKLSEAHFVARLESTALILRFCLRGKLWFTTISLVPLWVIISSPFHQHLVFGKVRNVAINPKHKHLCLKQTNCS